MKSTAKKASQQEVESPSPAELLERCQEIQARWTARERRRRSVTTAPDWTAPTVHLAETVRDRSGHWILQLP